MLTPASYVRLWALWLAIAVTLFFACMCLGPGDPGTTRISVGWPSTSELTEIRALRILPAALVGFALAAAGLTLQALLRNPLADPYVLGISSGSSVGVMLWLLCTGPFVAVVGSSPWGRFILQQGQVGPALAGAIVTCILVFVLARSRWGGGGGGDPLTLLLVGVVISAINGAILMLLNSLATEGVQKNFINYIMGAISNDVRWTDLNIAAVILLLGYIPVLLAARSLNIGSLSDMEATSLGINVARLRNLCFLCASIMTAAAIILSGPIGFVGLICPHICRRLVGSDHRKLTVAVPFCGAAFLMLADTFVNITGGIFHGELPVGVITALCGGPFFLVLLKHRRSGGGAE